MVWLGSGLRVVQMEFTTRTAVDGTLISLKQSPSGSSSAIPETSAGLKPHIRKFSVTASSGASELFFQYIKTCEQTRRAFSLL